MATTSESVPPLGDADATTTAAVETGSFQDLIAAPLASQLPWHERMHLQPLPVPRIQSTTAAPRPREPVDEMTKDQLRMLLMREKFWRDVQNGRRTWRARKKKRVKPARVQLTDWTQCDQTVLADAKQAIIADYARCPCVQCTLLRREDQPDVEYRCTVLSCTTRHFTDFVELFEHQVRVHGKIHPQCRRVRAELFGQSNGVVPYPPVTVYVGQQFLVPAYRPTEWTLERVEREKKTLRGKLFGRKQSQTVPGAVHVWDSFLMAYHQVVRCGGLAQLRAQQVMALEYYESALVNPVGTRTFQDGANIVGNGRNWLAMAPELERAEHMTPFRYEHEKKDDPFRGFNSDSEDDNAGDDSDDQNEEDDSMTLLFESGEPITFNAPVAAAIAEKRRVFVTQAHTKRKRKNEDANRCSVCHREGHRKDTCPEGQLEVNSEPKKDRVYRCSVCKQEGHQKIKCPEAVKNQFLLSQEGITNRCSKCGLRGHKIFQCLQPSDEALDPRVS